MNNPYAADNPYAQHNPYADTAYPAGDQIYPPMEGGPMYPYQDQYTLYHINNGGSSAYCYPDQGDLYWQSSPSPHNMYYL